MRNVGLVAVLMGLLVYLIVRPVLWGHKEWDTHLNTAGALVASQIEASHIRRIGAALEHTQGDARILSAALPPARSNQARLVLIHVVDTPGVMLLGHESGSRHALADEAYLDELAREIEDPDLPVETSLQFGRAADQIVLAVKQEGLDMLVLGSHGHQGIGDLVHGQTVSAVRHQVQIPVLVVPSGPPEPAL